MNKIICKKKWSCPFFQFVFVHCLYSIDAVYLCTMTTSHFQQYSRAYCMCPESLIISNYLIAFCCSSVSFENPKLNLSHVIIYDPSN